MSIELPPSLAADAVCDELEEVVVEEVLLQPQHLAHQLPPRYVRALQGNKRHSLGLAFPTRIVNALARQKPGASVRVRIQRCSDAL